jgi:hypothetical protein
MPLPTSIVVNGKTWTVELVDWLWRKRRQTGLCQRWRKRILVDCACQSEWEQGSTLWHEAVHAAFPQTICDADQEERIVKRLEWRLRNLVCFRAACGRRR